MRSRTLAHPVPGSKFGTRPVFSFPYYFDVPHDSSFLCIPQKHWSRHVTSPANASMCVPKNKDLYF